MNEWIINQSITHDEPITPTVLVFGELFFKTVQCRIHPCIPWCDIKSIGLVRTHRLEHSIATWNSYRFRSSLPCVLVALRCYLSSFIRWWPWTAYHVVPYHTIPYRTRSFDYYSTVFDTILASTRQTIRCIDRRDTCTNIYKRWMNACMHATSSSSFIAVPHITSHPSNTRSEPVT